MFYKRILQDNSRTLFEISYEDKSGEYRIGHIALRNFSHVDRAQLLYLLQVESQRHLKNFKKTIKRRK